MNITFDAKVIYCTGCSIYNVNKVFCPYLLSKTNNTHHLNPNIFTIVPQDSEYPSFIHVASLSIVMSPADFLWIWIALQWQFVSPSHVAYCQN